MIFLLRCLYTAAFLAALWALGLAAFVADMGSLAKNRATTAADAIVVLTGGSERVKAGVDLLLAGQGKKLLISGVHPGTGRSALLKGMNVPASKQQCCIELGHMAIDTYGNAAESAVWLKEHGYRSALLVTSHYHMRRSLLEFRMMLPDVALVPHAVAPGKIDLDAWWQKTGTANLLVTEYNKYLVALARYLLYSLG